MIQDYKPVKYQKQKIWILKHKRKFTLINQAKGFLER